MKAIIRLEVPEYQIGEEVSCYFKDTMSVKGICEKAEPRKGEWLRMSDLPGQEDDRYQCSYCRNVVHYKNIMDLYTFSRWCGRCGSNNER